jgi:metallo-beta-lactamase class B
VRCLSVGDATTVSRSLLLRRMALLMVVVTVASWPVVQKAADQRTLWNQPFEPFRVVGNVYFVGTADLSSFLIVTPEGSFLLDGGLKESPPLIVQSIKKLGFRLEDVKYLLNSHAHYDHAGGLAELLRLSGATMVVSDADAQPLRTGNRDVPGVNVGRTIADGASLQLGNTRITAHVTPGHTRGCTTWSTIVAENGRDYRVVFHCGTRVVTRLIGNPLYPEMAADYEHTFRRLRDFEADVFLAEHPRFFDMANKVRRMRAGEPNPFIDPTEMRRFVDRSEREFRAALATEQAARPGS